jgi:hypothetical protein
MLFDKINEKLKTLHDYKLVMIENDHFNNSIHLIFINEDKTIKIEIVLYDVVEIKCTNWNSENIVLDCYVIDTDNPNSKKRLLDLLIYTLDLNKIQLKNNTFEPLLNNILHKETFILEVNPSFGAYLVAIFKKIQFNSFPIPNMKQKHCQRDNLR